MHFPRDELLTDTRVAQKEGVPIIAVPAAACAQIPKMRATHGMRAIRGRRRMIRAVRA